MSPSPLRHPARLAGASLLRLQSDERLAELAAAGHEAAFATIVDRYRTPLTRYCAGIVGPSRAEDAVQQTLINAHDALQRTDEVRHLRSWLYRIAHNAALNVLRAVRDDVSLDAASDATAVVEDGPAAAFERSERFQATLAALQALPERQRAALVLRELEGRSHEEIAETLGVTKGSARQHLMRARVALRTAVTAITPYPVVVRLAEMVASPSAVGWTDAAVGAGAGATLAKLTAGVAATGALVGGAVGTERVVHHRHSGQEAAQRSSEGSATQPRPTKARAVSLPTIGTIGGTGSSPGSSGPESASSRSDDRKGKGRDDERGRDRSRRRGSEDSGRNRGSDDSGSDRGSHGRGGRSGSAGGGGSRDDDNRGDRRGRGRGGSKDSDDGKHGSVKQDSYRSAADDRRSSGSGSRSRTSDSSSSGGSSTSGRGRGSSDDNSGSGSGHSDGDDHAGSSTTSVAPIATPTAPSTDSDSGSGSGGSGRSGDDDADSSGRSGSN